VLEVVEGPEFDEWAKEMSAGAAAKLAEAAK
jgi:hypothetical protein